MANAILAPLMAIPFRDVISETMIAPATTAAPPFPSASFTASDIGDEELASAGAGSAYCTAAFTSM